MKKQVTWTLTSGAEANVSIELLTRRTINADGHSVEVDCCEIDVTGRIEGMGIVGTSIDHFGPRIVQGVEVVGACGRLAIQRDQMSQIDAAVAEIKATPEWQAKEAKIAQAEKEAWEYEQHAAKMRAIMGDF